MPKINPDLTQVGPIPPATYRGRILSCDFKTSAKGNPMIVPKFELDVNGTPRERDAYLVISGPGARQFLQLLRACGFTELADAYTNPAAEKPDFDTDDLIGQEVLVTIEASIYNDEPSDQIKMFSKI
jgi:hypothetical protein